ncbi:helix-turn-helix transcriptional regulator [Mesorhizobium silamurunense]|uniref:helix-turn-helix transcriptional regulator n=1 Tax=Mesorhizobium silamurunense TaxID=499528 RepID=UPI00178139FD|nr:helix-turn-helix transcriptional regulator [Mesorhizobium silamurunense]
MEQQQQFRSDGTWQPLTRERLADLIGLIYDCTLDPTLWPEAIRAVGDATNCFAGMLVVTDLERSEVRSAHSWNHDPIWLARLPAHAEEIAQLQNEFLARSHGLGEPSAPSREIVEPYESRYYKEWAKPQGIVDALSLIVIRQADRLGLLSLSRHEHYGLVTEEDIAVLRLLAPHIRRAVAIGDLMDMKSLEQQALGATLDSVTVGVVIVAEEGRILHTNETARRMLDARSPILSSGGYLAATNNQISEELLKAIAVAQADETRVPATGVGVPLGDVDHKAAVAHILPLARGHRRTRLMPQATAAVFITRDAAALPTELGTVARMFGLTPAETRQLEQLMAGATLSKAAAALQVSEATARTHREHIFAKMGVSRQGDLVALVRRLMPPIRQRSAR